MNDKVANKYMNKNLKKKMKPLYIYKKKNLSRLFRIEAKNI